MALRNEVSQNRKEVVQSGQKGEAKKVTQFELNHSNLGDSCLLRSLETFPTKGPSNCLNLAQKVPQIAIFPIPNQLVPQIDMVQFSPN